MNILTRWTLSYVVLLVGCREAPAPIVQNLDVVMAQPGWVIYPKPFEYRETGRRLVQSAHVPGGCSRTETDSTAVPAGVMHVGVVIARNRQTCQSIVADGFAPVSMMDSVVADAKAKAKS